jgi:putative ABC transport system permease protein
MRALRNIFRRKLRAFLTITGITIGVFALVVMGGMAEKINLLVDGGTRYYSDKVTISDGNSPNSMASTPMSIGRIPQIEAVDGVAKASANIFLLLDNQGSVSMGVPAMVIGSDLRGSELESFKLSYKSGRALRPGETGVATVGSDLVKKLGAEVGKPITVKGRQFMVVGIMDKTLTAPDSEVFISMADAQELYVKELPKVIQTRVDSRDLATGITAFVKPGFGPDQVAKQVQAQVPGIKAQGPKAFQEQVGNATKILNAIIFGIALISLLVGGLSVVNTMTMSVFERVREIGIRKAIGASNGQVIRQFLVEAGLIGLIGGLGGLVLGWLFTVAANAAGNASGTSLFLVSTRLALGSVLFALLLGVVSGIYPAWHASRLNPVVALRFE